MIKLDELYKHQKNFLSFLYGAAVSVLLARVLIHHVQNHLPPTSYIVEILLLVGVIIFLSADWLARLSTRERIEGILIKQHEKLPPSYAYSFTIAWWIEIAGLLFIIVAFGSSLNIVFDNGLNKQASPIPPTAIANTIPYVLFSGYTILAVAFSSVIIYMDKNEQITYRRLLRESLAGDVSSLDKVKANWSPYYLVFLDRMHARFQEKHEKLHEEIKNGQVDSSNYTAPQRYARYLNLLNSLYLLIFQFVAQHLTIYNGLFCVIVLLGASFEYNDAVLLRLVSTDELTWLRYVIYGFPFFCLLASLHGFYRGPKKYGKSKTSAPRPSETNAIRRGNIFLLVGVVSLYVILDFKYLVLLVLAQQFFASVSLIAPHAFEGSAAVQEPK